MVSIKFYPKLEKEQIIVVLFFCIISFIMLILVSIMDHRKKVSASKTCDIVGLVSSILGLIALLGYVWKIQAHNAFIICGIYFFLITSGIFLFDLLYLVEHSHFTGNVQEEHPTNSFAYFTFVTVSTIGYGDITPASRIARMFVMMFISLSMFVNIYVIGVIFSKGVFQPILSPSSPLPSINSNLKM